MSVTITLDTTVASQLQAQAFLERLSAEDLRRNYWRRPFNSGLAP